MRKKTPRSRATVCVNSDGEAAVFLTRTKALAESGLEFARLAVHLASRGLRLVGVSRAAGPAPSPPAGMKCSPLATEAF